MKKSILIVFIMALNFSVHAQATAENVSGVYGLTYDATNALIIDTLTLNADGTFEFHEYDKHENGIPPERNKYGKGNWRLDKTEITFTTGEIDFDEKYTLDFNETKARFITKSPRDNSDREIKTSIQFYKSELSWVVKRLLVEMD